MKKLRIAICDSNPVNMEFYVALCRNLSLQYHIPVEIKSCPTGNDLLFDLENPIFKKRLDVVFYTLCSTNTVETVFSIREIGYAGLMIFIGAEEIKISPETLFDTGVFNFVRKGNKQKYVKRFEEVFRKAAEAISKMHQEKLALSYAGEIQHIDISDIQYFEKRDRGLTVYYGDNDKFYFISTITKLENQLKGRDFVRSSLSYLISLDAIQTLNSSEAVMKNGARIPVGRQYYSEIKEALNKKAVAL